MKRYYIFFVIITFVFAFANVSCNSKRENNIELLTEKPLEVSIHRSNILIDSAAINSFYATYTELKKYQENTFSLYQKHNFNQVWFDNKGIVEFGHSLYAQYSNIDKEGLTVVFPYQKKLDGIFHDEIESPLNQSDTELMITNLYFFYADKVYNGLDSKVTTEMGWLLPRKQISYVSLLDSVMQNSKASLDDKKVLIGQYYKLREVLVKYREIEKKGGWNPIDLEPNLKSYKPGDSAKVIGQIRERLFVTGDIKNNNKSTIYDKELIEAVNHYQIRNGFKSDNSILPKHIKEMNKTVADRIKQIMLNMERCRWMSPDITNSYEYVLVNIPSYNLTFIRDGKVALKLPVVVGKTMNKTVIFSGKMSYIVFSPYWYIPTSIIKKEVKPGMAKNKNYLAQHNMEWNNGNVRQKPGKNNSLGLVKFIFPNSNNIYLHDTPSKSLFENETRAYSHGCVRVGKARDLASTILKEDKNWTPTKIDAAMNLGRENAYVLKNKIPVYIGYFTAWVNENGELNFFQDIYERDDRLAKLLYSKK
ncbi:murein L,D-transpeptidase [Flavobacterium sp.]|jgi:murein L,D-transpeptidase YcbB/YkuD|uniref:murein L,D-transpeptidase n=1 Tax=Flavobacterium sp. TaxID=239 RepID=UPI0037C188E1